MVVLTNRLEASVVTSINTQLINLGWIVDEQSNKNNVTQQRPKTENERKKLRQASEGKDQFPDFILYDQNNLTKAIGVIEAKRPGESLDYALSQAERYAIPINAPLIFGYNGSFVVAKHVKTGESLKIDGEDIRQFIDPITILRFVNEGPELLSVNAGDQITHPEMIRIFKRQSNHLRDAGLQAGMQRFEAFSDILFLKLMDEQCELQEKLGKKILLESSVRWDAIMDKKPSDRLKYVNKVIWPEMHQKFGEILSPTCAIKSEEVFDDIVNDLSKYNFSSTDVDVKGDAFEYFLKNAYQGVNINDLGEYFTPRNIVKIMVSMVDPKFREKIYDPFCGTGGFLIEAFKYISLRLEPNKEDSKVLKENTVYGSEIAETARAAKMNMILFGDGHSNIVQQDSFANPVIEKFDIVLTNPPYSQKTKYGNYYDIPTKNGDAIAIQHCLKSLKPNGRGAILVKDNFLTSGGDIGKVREMMMNSVTNLNIVSLPRGLFLPYTPTKTSIIYFEKSGKSVPTFFSIVKNVGHTFGARKVSTLKNDLPNVLSTVRDTSGKINCVGWKVENSEVQKKGSWWPYDYKEFYPNLGINHEKFDKLGDYISEKKDKFKPYDTPSDKFEILGVSNSYGIFVNEIKLGAQINQSYKKVNEGDIVYNPHRINVGSIGVVSSDFDGGIVPGIYVVFQSKVPEKISPYYIVATLKTKPYREVINEYDTYGSVRANLSFQLLSRIRIITPSQKIHKEFQKKYQNLERLKQNVTRIENELLKMAIERK